MPPLLRALPRLALLLFPSVCVHCGESVDDAMDGALCRGCWEGVGWLKGADQSRRGKDWQFDALYSVGRFEGALREAVHAWKFAGKTSLRRPFLRHLTELAANAPGLELLAWPPTAVASIKERGFDPARELAESLASELGLETIKGLKRARQGEKQATLGRQERWINARGAFECGQALSGKKILLVDDVVTTGATLSAAAQALKNAGASSVVAITLASGELRGN